MMNQSSQSIMSQKQAADTFIFYYFTENMNGIKTIKACFLFVEAFQIPQEL
jgi:hypothetical protein